jgi:hypothetical protein
LLNLRVDFHIRAATAAEKLSIAVGDEGTGEDEHQGQANNDSCSGHGYGLLKMAG